MVTAQTDVELHSRYLHDGRLLCWYHDTTTDTCHRFMTGRDELDGATGHQLLADNALRHDGGLLGPVVPPPASAATRRIRPRRPRRW